MFSRARIALIRRALFVSSMTLALAGCADPGATKQALLDPPEASLLTQCPPPELLDETKAVLMGDMADYDTALAIQYRICALRHAGLIKWVNTTVEKLKR